jgi:hypothetical protein
MQIKTAMTFQLTPPRVAIVQNKQLLLRRMWKNGNPDTMLEGKCTSIAIMKNSGEIT